VAHDGSKRERVIDLLTSGLSDPQIAERAGCSRSLVIAIRKELGMERPVGRGMTGLRDRIEQAIARELPDETIARELGVPAHQVAKVRADMDRAASESRWV
jgi:AraC-like DNA-binding protein